ncbi:MAG: hypothetical protein ACRDYD_01225, partial [Acidimicrobiales bacterium]
MTLRRLCQTLQEGLRARRVSVWLLDEDAEALICFAAASSEEQDPVHAEGHWIALPLAEFSMGAELLSAAPTRCGTLPGDARLPEVLTTYLGLGSASWVALSAGVPSGLLVVEPVDAAESGELEAVLPLVASSALLARRWRVEERRRALADLLLDLSEATSRDRPLDEMLASLGRRVAERLSARGVTVLLAEDDRLVARSSQVATDDAGRGGWIELHPPAAPTDLARAALSGGRLLTEPTAGDG